MACVAPPFSQARPHNSDPVNRTNQDILGKMSQLFDYVSSAETAFAQHDANFRSVVLWGVLSRVGMLTSL